MGNDKKTTSKPSTPPQKPGLSQPQRIQESYDPSKKGK